MLILGQEDEELGVELLSRIREAVQGRPADIEDGTPLSPLAFASNQKTLKEAVMQLERAMIRSALMRTGGNKSTAAKELGISRSSFFNH